MKGERRRTDAERYALMERAVILYLEGNDRKAIAKDLGVSVASLDKWKATKDYKDIDKDVRASRRDILQSAWHDQLKTAIRMVKRIEREGNPDSPTYIEALRYIVDSQGLGPEEERGDNAKEESGQRPIAIQINQGTTAELEDALRSRLGSGDGD